MKNINKMEVDKDHIHILVDSEPKLSPLMIIRVLKQQSTQIIYGRYKSELKKYFWKENTFWFVLLLSIERGDCKCW